MEMEVVRTQPVAVTGFGRDTACCRSCYDHHGGLLEVAARSVVALLDSSVAAWDGFLLGHHLNLVHHPSFLLMACAEANGDGGGWDSAWCRDWVWQGHGLAGDEPVVMSRNESFAMIGSLALGFDCLNSLI
ncbi:hypothetical protein L1987_30125 [Smallanthus sonchifolius]|uniref:Uncharacterized protein n=1 Tax=Smallanthus sonchifolius TaxID=185202 RepID=A0ACB9I2R6_9ASTR|nr:hypothetical protein L1987_30125 [Smallanthus sonchifolius]